MTMVVPVRLMASSTSMMPSEVVGVEVAGGLVGQQNLRVIHVGAGDGHTLLLATGELMRIVLFLAGEAHGTQRLGTNDLMVDRHVPITSRANATFSHTVLLLSSL